jgi:hypothetical protein
LALGWGGVKGFLRVWELADPDAEIKQKRH